MTKDERLDIRLPAADKAALRRIAARETLKRNERVTPMSLAREAIEILIETYEP